MKFHINILGALHLSTTNAKSPPNLLESSESRNCLAFNLLAMCTFFYSSLNDFMTFRQR